MGKITKDVEIKKVITVEIDEQVIKVVNDEWRGLLYDLQGDNEIISHVVGNIAGNGLKLSQLEGWADQPDSNVKIISDSVWECEVLD